ncbi:hypothetical protein RFI_34190, partial [Reticulomyxa filosa]
SYCLAQCISFKDEVLICGGYKTNDCYSYHTLQKKYKYICSYPADVELIGHCVVKIKQTDDVIHLLSFGGQGCETVKQTFVMKYKSVWNDISNVDSKEDNQEFNIWIKNDNNKNIGKYKENLKGAKGLICGQNDDLLFITYYPKNIKIINLNDMSEIHQNKIEISCNNYNFGYHCFEKLEKNTFILFCNNAGMSIEYDEFKNKISYEERLCFRDLDISVSSFIYLYDYIFLFGGKDKIDEKTVKSIYKYSISYRRWTKCDFTLPIELSSSFAIFSDHNAKVRIIGGQNNNEEMKIHLIMDVESIFDMSDLVNSADKYKTIGYDNIIPKEIEDQKEKIIQLKSKLEKLDKEEEKIDLNKIEWLEIWCSDDYHIILKIFQMIL